MRSPSLREPSDALDERVNATFAQYRFKPTRRFQFYKLAMAACVLIAVGISVRFYHPKAPPVVATTVSKPGPIQIERQTSTVYDDGVIASTDDAAYEKFRRRTVREIWYINPGTHAKMLVTIPTEEIMIQKVDAF